MESKELIRCLHLMADTIDDLEITDILSCDIDNSMNMSIHLYELTLSGIDATWTERLDCKYKWEKAFVYNNIKFYAIYTEEGYNEEKKYATNQTKSWNL